MSSTCIFKLLVAIEIINFVYADAKVYGVQNKIVLLTGGARGIGFGTVGELLNNGVKGISLIDIDIVKGRQVAKTFNLIYGHGKVIFIPADISNFEQFNNAFKISIAYWKTIDIVINNAGYYNENEWKRVVDVNVVGTLQGTLLAFEYMSTRKGGRGGVIINIASVAGIEPLFYVPTYAGSKHFIVGLGRALGQPIYYRFNHIRIATICPGATATEGFASEDKIATNMLSPYVKQQAENVFKRIGIQTVSNMAKGIIRVIKEGDNGSVWVIEDDEAPYEVDIPNRKSMLKSNKTYNYIQNV